MDTDYDGYFREAHDGLIRSMVDARRYLNRLDPHLELSGFRRDHGAYAAARSFFGAVSAEVDRRIGNPVSAPVLEALKSMEAIASECRDNADRCVRMSAPRYMYECRPAWAR